MLTGQKIAERICYYLAQQGWEWINGTSIVPMFSRGPLYSNPDNEADSTPLPKIVVSVEQADVTVPFSPAWRAMVTLELTSNADDTTAAEHDAHFDELGELFIDGATARDALSALDGFACYMLVLRNQQHGFDARSFQSRLTIEAEVAEVAAAAV